MGIIVENINNVKQVDFIVGTPSLNEAETIGNVCQVADKGLSEYFPNLSSAIINVDNHSEDGTREAFLSTATYAPKIYISTPDGERGKGRNVRNLFKAAVELQAKAVVMIDSDLTSFKPKWIHLLGEPLLNGYDYVSPIYERHKYDASITNHFACPLLRALYGFRIRQPIGGDFGFSGKMAMAYLSEKNWTENVANFGIDIWMTTMAITRGLPVCQTFLGGSKNHRVKDPAKHLSGMFTNVIATIFDLMIDFEYLWRNTDGSKPSNIMGYGLGVKDVPPVPDVDTDILHQTFLTGLADYSEIWNNALSKEQYLQLQNLGKLSRESFEYPSTLWIQILYNMAVAYRNNNIDRQQLIDSMIPLYYSRMLSYVNRTREMNTAQCEDYLDNIYRVYEREKPYLLKRWDEDKLKKYDILRSSGKNRDSDIIAQNVDWELIDMERHKNVRWNETKTPGFICE